MFTIDAHLDLAINAMAQNRDLTQSVFDIRQKEKMLGWTDTPDRGNGTVALPELRKGKVGVVVATIISRVDTIGHPFPSAKLTGWHTPEQAYAFAMAQLTWYQTMEQQGQMVQIRDLDGLNRHVGLWQDKSIDDQSKPIGYILSLEGADSVINMHTLEVYHQLGLRAIGPAHFGPGRYAAGTHSDGSGITEAGFVLLKEMDRLGMILDVTHLTDKGFFEAMDNFGGTVWASHQNCRSIVPGERQFSDKQLKILIQRNGVVGGALDDWMLQEGYVRGEKSPKEWGIGLERLVDHFDHICQLAGNTHHVAFGSDLDGLFGTEQTPYDLDTIMDLQRFQEILLRRGYASEAVEQIFHGNWLRLLRRTWSV